MERIPDEVKYLYKIELTDGYYYTTSDEDGRWAWINGGLVRSERICPE